MVTSATVAMVTSKFRLKSRLVQIKMTSKRKDNPNFIFLRCALPASL